MKKNLDNIQGSAEVKLWAESCIILTFYFIAITQHHSCLRNAIDFLFAIWFKLPVILNKFQIMINFICPYLVALSAYIAT